MTSFLLAHVFGAFVHVYVFFQSLSVKTRLLFLSTPPVSEPQIREITGNPCGELARTNERCGIYSEALIELCQGMDIKVIDLWNAIQKKDDWLTACFLDGIHFSSKGSEIVVEEIMKVLKEADWEPSLYWNSIPDEFADDSVDIVSSNGKAKNMANSTLHGETQRD